MVHDFAIVMVCNILDVFSVPYLPQVTLLCSASLTQILCPFSALHLSLHYPIFPPSCHWLRIYVTGNMWNQGFHVIPGHFRDFMKLLNYFREFVKSLKFSGFPWNPWKITPQQEDLIRKKCLQLNIQLIIIITNCIMNNTKH